MGAWIWYLLAAVLAWAFHLPAIALVGAVLFLAIARLPDPLAWIERARHERTLRARARAYPGDLLTRRTLARVLLSRGEAREARSLLEESIAKGLDDDETFYLLGCARLANRDPQSALEPLVQSVATHERFLFGEPYKRAAEALCLLERYEEAEDALDRAIAVNSSDLEARLALGRVRLARRDSRGARAAWSDCVRAFRESPDYLRAKQWRPALWAFALSLWHRGP